MQKQALISNFPGSAILSVFSGIIIHDGYVCKILLHFRLLIALTLDFICDLGKCFHCLELRMDKIVLEGGAIVLFCCQIAHDYKSGHLIQTVCYDIHIAEHITYTRHSLIRLACCLYIFSLCKLLTFDKLFWLLAYYSLMCWSTHSELNANIYYLSISTCNG